VEAELLVHLGEIDERKLYLDWSFSSMFAFCVGELGFSEDVACNRINVARAARRMPVILEVVRSGQVHLAGLRALAPHLTTENQEQVLAEAAGKSKREIEELVARLAPQPAVPTVIRKLPEPRNSAPESPTFSFGIAVPAAPSESSPALAFAPPPAPRREERRAVVAPLAEDAFKFQFTGSRACHDKFRQAQDLLRHRIPDGDLATIFEKALDLLIEQVMKERFATGRRARPAPTGDASGSSSRHIPDAIKREVFEGDGGRIEHSELVFGEGLIMVGESEKRERFPYHRSPREVGGFNTQNLMLYVDDVEAHCRRAREAGAKIVSEPSTDDYGEEYWSDRGYECEDVGGHHWWFYQRLRDPKPKA